MSRITVAAIAVIFLFMIAALVYGIVQRDHRITDLEHDNAVAFRLCGVVMCVPCNKGETGPHCQARMGDTYEVIYYPDAQTYVAELRGNE